MVASSGSLGGGDDSSKLDALAKSIAENSEKLEILNKILGKIEDVGDSEKKKELSTSDILKNVEKIVSKADIEKARASSKAMQVDADRLASNTFRASETVLSEVLSRLGGTSFYPVLSAFRVARESVSVATGTPQSELKVNDIIQFVNQSTTELLTNIFTKFEFGVNSIEEPVVDLNKALEQTKQDLIDIREALMPVTTDIKKSLDEIMKLDPSSEEFQKLTLEEMQKYAEYIIALNEAGDATSEHIMLLNELDRAYQVTGQSIRDVIDKEQQKKLLENIEKEKAVLAKEGPQLQQKLYEERAAQSEIQREAMQASKTIAGIAGALIPIGFAISDLQDLAYTLGDLKDDLANIAVSSVTNPEGGNKLQGLSNIVNTTSEGATQVAGLIGNALGSKFGPLGSVIGGMAAKTVVSTLLAPVNIAAQMLVSINDSVTSLKDDLIGLDPELTASLIGQEILILRDDFRRAAQIGPQVARITEAQTRLQLASRQAFDNFLVVTEPILVATLDTLTVLVEQTSQIGKLLYDYSPLIIGVNNLNQIFKDVSQSVDDIAARLGTDDPLELQSLAFQGGNQFFANNPAAAVRLK